MKVVKWHIIPAGRGEYTLRATFYGQKNNDKKNHADGKRRGMTESVITEFTGSRLETVTRSYHYGVDGVSVSDSHGAVRRLYRFDPSSSMMTEVDPARPGKVLRRFVFDSYGMLEETFSFGQPPRTFRYEGGGQRIVMREGGEYGAVGKTFSFEGNGVAETAFGRDGTIERVYVFEPGNRSITIRGGGWYGSVERKLTFERMDASVFLRPEAFLQFLVFTEKSPREIEKETDEQVAKIRGAMETAGRSRYAYTGVRHASGDSGDKTGAVFGRPGSRKEESSDPGIDFIPDADSAPTGTSRSSTGLHGRNGPVLFEERWEHATSGREELTPGRSARIPIDERFRSSREEERTLNPGKSVEIPLEERFRRDGEERDELTPGKSAQIPYEERRTGRRMR